MKQEFVNLELVKNVANNRFEIQVDKHMAFIEYKQNGNTITLVHTEVEPELEGKGAATAVVEKTLDYIEKNNFKLIPICPFVKTYIQRHPEWEKIVDANA